MNPFSATRAGSVAEWGEVRLIESIRHWLGAASPPPPLGIGDDCAVFSPAAGAEVLVTTDPVLWERHFDETVAPEQAAGKLLKRNLSDIAAMGGRGRMAVVSLLLPPATSIEWLGRFHHGLREASLRYGVSLAGGDVSQSDSLLGACMTLVGETVAGRALTRRGAGNEHGLYVTGRLGGSLRGHHLSFEPRLAEGQWLAAREEVAAAMDLSDGLAKDLPAFLPSGCEAELFPEAVPVSADALAMAASSGRPPLYHALCDGEDYELLVALKPGADSLVEEWKRRFVLPLTRIGLVRQKVENVQRSPLRGLPPGLAEEVCGYEHLR